MPAASSPVRRTSFSQLTPDPCGAHTVFTNHPLAVRKAAQTPSPPPLGTKWSNSTGKRDSSPETCSRGVAGAQWAAGGSQAHLPSWSPQPPQTCTFGQGGNREVQVPSLFASLSQTPLEEPHKVPLGDITLLVAGCPWQPFRGAGFLWAGKAPRFLSADTLLYSFVVTCRSCAGRHSEQSPDPD